MSVETPANGVYVGPTAVNAGTTAFNGEVVSPVVPDSTTGTVRNLPVETRIDPFATMLPASQDRPVSLPLIFANGGELSPEQRDLLDKYTLGFSSKIDDFNSDSVSDNVVVDGTKISVLSGKDGSVIIAPFSPFEAAYTGTLNYVVYNASAFSKPQLIVAPSNGGGGVVAVYDNTGKELTRFFGIDDANFRGGNSLTLADINADGKQDLVVTAGPGGGPRVAIFDGNTLAGNATRLQPDFFAFESTQTGGVNANVTQGRIFFGAGAGGGPRVRGMRFTELKNATASGFLETASFGGTDTFVTDPSNRNGVKLIQQTTSDPGTQYDYLRILADFGDGNLIEVANDNPPVSPGTIDNTSAGMTSTLPDLTSLQPFGSQGLKIRDVVVGQGASVSGNQDVQVYYTGWLAANGTEFDSNRNGESTDFDLQGVIAGFRDGMQGMKPGGIRQIFIPAPLAYGVNGSGTTIPPNSNLVFEVKLLQVTEPWTINSVAIDTTLTVE